MMKYIIAFTYLIMLLACNRNGDDVSEVGDIGTKFYPIKTGLSREYFVDSIAYDDNDPQDPIDSFTYLYKEVITDTFTDGTQHLAYVVSRYFKQNDTDDTWHDAGVYKVQHKNNMITTVEDNMPYLKLVFPIKDRGSWNGNLFNGFEPQAYRITEFKQPFQFQSVTYSSIKVDQYNTKNVIEEVRRYERYAENIGLVELLFDSLNTQTSGTKGFRYRLKLKAIN